MQLILIIDTDSHSLATIESYLAGMRNRIISTSNAKRGFEYARTSPADVIIAGISPADREMAEYLIRIKKDPLSKDSAILLLFHQSSAEHFISKIVSAVDAEKYLMKPISKDKLTKTVQSILNHESIIKGPGVRFDSPEFISIDRHVSGRTQISFRKSLKNNVLPEMRNVITPEFLKEVADDICCLDLRMLPEMTEEDVEVLERIVKVFGAKRVAIISGGHLGAILTHSDLEDKVNLFMSMEEFENFLNM